MSEAEPSHDSLQAWIASRPESIQKLAREFPLGSRVKMPDGRWWFLIGWSEYDAVLVSPIDPKQDYDGSIITREAICADHFRTRKV